jgi:CDP-diacylglycerol---glycerol-3-phosphate 3-phosphatidyltransferase
MTLADWITLIRFPLALLFFFPGVLWRTLILGLALLSDYLDGLIARRKGLPSRIGRILDPLADKWFVLFVVSIFLSENALTWWQAMALFARDWALILFAIYLWFSGRWSKLAFQPFWWGKVSTVAQIVLLAFLTWHIPLPPWTYGAFWALGGLGLRELILRAHRV